MISMSELLQPQQIETLEWVAAQSQRTAVRRRARVLLLYQAGQTTREITDAVALSPHQVRYWRRQFQTKGMAIFPEALPATAPSTSPRHPPMPEPAYDDHPLALSGNGMPSSASEAEPEAAAVPATDTFDLNDSSLYVNRELSMLAFQRRVFE